MPDDSTRRADRAARLERKAEEAELDAILADSFPASDPPPWTLGVGRDVKEPAPVKDQRHPVSPDR